MLLPWSFLCERTAAAAISIATRTINPTIIACNMRRLLQRSLCFNSVDGVATEKAFGDSDWWEDELPAVEATGTPS